MKRSILIMALFAILVSGCGQNTSGGQPRGKSANYSDSAPAKMLAAPDEARDAAKAATERVDEIGDAIRE